MTSNTWGPVSFIIMAPENFSPKYPDGKFKNRILEGGLELESGGYNPSPYRDKYASYEVSNTFTVGLIDKEGKYIAPEITTTD